MECIINEEKHRKLTKENLVSRIKAEDWLYILDDINSERLYLILGKEKALLFDTGYGFCDYRQMCIRDRIWFLWTADILPE